MSGHSPVFALAMTNPDGGGDRMVTRDGRRHARTPARRCRRTSARIVTMSAIARMVRQLAADIETVQELPRAYPGRQLRQPAPKNTMRRSPSTTQRTEHRGRSPRSVHAHKEQEWRTY